MPYRAAAAHVAYHPPASRRGCHGVRVWADTASNPPTRCHPERSEGCAVPPAMEAGCRCGAWTRGGRRVRRHPAARWHAALCPRYRFGGRGWAGAESNLRPSGCYPERSAGSAVLPATYAGRRCCARIGWGGGCGGTPPPVGTLRFAHATGSAGADGLARNPTSDPAAVNPNAVKDLQFCRRCTRGVGAARGSAGEAGAAAPSRPWARCALPTLRVRRRGRAGATPALLTRCRSEQSGGSAILRALRAPSAPSR
jgi:hypothetical protein